MGVAPTAATTALIVAIAITSCASSIIPPERDEIASGGEGRSAWEISAYRKPSGVVCMVLALRGTEFSSCDANIRGQPDSPTRPCYMDWTASAGILAGSAAKKVASIVVLHPTRDPVETEPVSHAEYPINFFWLEPGPNAGGSVLVAFDASGRFIDDTPDLPWAEQRVDQLKTESGISPLPVGAMC